MASHAYSFVTPEEYLEWEIKHEERYEYLQGNIYAMAGASISHDDIVMNISGTLFARLKGRCRVAASNTRVRTEGASMYTYPDVAVVCAERRIEKYKGTDTLLNPVIIFEVLSPSTEKYDRRVKFQMYREISSLQEYVLVAQDRFRVERFIRQPDGKWKEVVLEGADAVLRIPSISASLKFSEIYDGATPRKK